VKALAVSPSGRYFVSGHEDGSIVVWRSDGACLGKKADHGSEPNTVAFAPDGLHLLTAGVGSEAFVWAFADGEIDVQTRTGFKHGSPIESAAFSPEGKRIVTGGEDQSVAVWSMRDHAEVLPRMRHAQQLWYAEFSPDGLTLVTASQDGTAQLWDALTGERIGPPMRHTQAVSIARFEPDSRRIVTGSFDGNASLWHFPIATDSADGMLERTENASGLHLDSDTGGIRVRSR